MLSKEKERTNEWNTKTTVSYPASEGEAVDKLEEGLGQFGSHHMLQVDLVALQHGVGVLGAPPHINPVMRTHRREKKKIKRLKSTISFFKSLPLSFPPTPFNRMAHISGNVPSCVLCVVRHS